jgi:superoxide reductase
VFILSNKNAKFYFCKHCGNFVEMIHNSGVPMICCGEPMAELTPNSREAAHEKHLPVICISDGMVTVKIGSVPHPMTEEHYIQWIYLETENGIQRKMLEPGDKPETVFAVIDDKVLAAYEFCNIHGLWVTSVE